MKNAYGSSNILELLAMMEVLNNLETDLLHPKKEELPAKCPRCGKLSDSSECMTIVLNSTFKEDFGSLFSRRKNTLYSEDLLNKNLKEKTK